MVRFTIAEQTSGSTLILPVTSGGRQRWMATLDGLVPDRSLFPKSLGERVTICATKPSRRNPRVVLLGVGEAGDKRKAGGEEASAAGGRWYREMGGRVAAAVRSLELDGVDVVLPVLAKIESERAVGCFCEGFELGSFRAGRHKSKRASGLSVRVNVVCDEVEAKVRRAAKAGQAVAAAANYTRQISHEPANIVNPAALARAARSLAKSAGLKCTVLDERGMARLKMGGLLAVGTSSASMPRLIVLEFGGRGRGGAGSDKPVVLIGKAVTFDTGGYSIKDKNSIVGMKYDKCGGTAVLGVMKSLSVIRPGRRVVGIIAAAENMISSRAYRPSDVITMMSGQTVEIISTDAEGRMVLADALTYALKKYRPACVIDLATLTGACVVALGSWCAGALGNDPRLLERVRAAGERSGERVWPLPLWDEHKKAVESHIADVKNTGGREAGTLTAAAFLSHFVGDIPWIHLDIAGTAWTKGRDPTQVKGATGFGVRLLVELLRSWRS